MDIGPQLSPRDPTVRNRLKRRPILGGNQRFLSKPFRDGLLAHSRPVHKLRDFFRQDGLATRDSDGALQGGNVLLFHKPRGYTTRVVHVNNPECVRSNNDVCTVLTMPASNRKRVIQPLPAERLKAIPGPDGYTLGERLRYAMDAKSQSLGREFTASELLVEATRLVGLPPDKPIQTQQALSKILNNLVSESAATPAYAAILGVQALWLGHGVGPITVIEALQRARK